MVRQLKAIRVEYSSTIMATMQSGVPVHISPVKISEAIRPVSARVLINM